MIRIEKLNKYFNYRKKNQIHVINNTSLEFNSTGLVALLGPSGCGKTTLLNTIGGLDKVNNGHIYINNQRITRIKSRKVDKVRNLSIGYIFQDYHLIDDMSVFDNIALVLKMIGIKDPIEIKSRVNYVLETVGIYRYRNRLAGMLSGGERQRVGIARAIVKNPDIILADEPTGNLDSKNTIEIMNIIKSISKTKLVILVTHEKDLAYFYSTRIIELKDGKVESDKQNIHNNDLDYHMDNKIYLKDIKEHETIKNKNYNIKLYNDSTDKIDVELVVKNNNIYIKCNSNNKVEVLDSGSNIELVDDYYHKINKKEYEEYKFDLDKLNNDNIKIKYSSIINPIRMIKQGFKKIGNYTVIKKLLLLGFFISAMFVMYSISNIFGTLEVKDKDFIKQNKNYLTIIKDEVNVNDYLEYAKDENINYLIPGDSTISMTISFNDYLQTMYAQEYLSGSLSSLNMINSDEIIYGRMPSAEYEFVADKMILDTLLDSNSAKSLGIKNYEQLLNRIFKINNMPDFTLVGITDLKNPSIYMNESLFINVIANAEAGMSDNNDFAVSKTNEGFTTTIDYNLMKDEVKLIKGKYPDNDYEVVVNESMKEVMPINKKADYKINNVKLKIVGYYSDSTDSNYYLVNQNTMNYYNITNKQNIIVYPKDKEKALEDFRNKNVNIISSYDKAKQEFIDNRKEGLTITLIVAGIILLISLIEIYLIVRASFLSRIKEVGILRAIGVKKRDIYKMFLGEILAITSTASVLGYIFMYYILNEISTIRYLKGMFLLNYEVFVLGIVFIYLFNIIVGLIPVMKTIKKTPAFILSRNDVD